MNYSLTPWLCGVCGSKLDKGYGAESKKYDDKYSQQLPCEECGRMQWFLIRYRIPEQDIRFEFISSYKHSASFYVLVDGKEVLTYENVPMRMEYIGNAPYLNSLEECKAEGYNVHEKEDWWLNFGAWPNTIHFESSGGPEGEALIPDNIKEAFEIFHDGIVRRAIFRSEWVKCDPDDPERINDTYLQKQINCRVEYY